MNPKTRKIINDEMLAIGNYVAYGEEVGKIIAIDENRNLTIETKSQVHNVGIDDVQPIRLTPEWMKTFRLKETNDKWTYYGENIEDGTIYAYCIDSAHDLSFVGTCDDYTIVFYVCYVHQLQNITRTLGCGNF